MTPRPLHTIATNFIRWLNTRSIQKRLHYLTLLNIFGLILLLLLGLLSGFIKDGYFRSIEELNSRQRQIQHFNAATARLQVSIQNHLTSPDTTLKQQIEHASASLLAELSSPQQPHNEYSENLRALHAALKTFISGYEELKTVNDDIDQVYQRDLLAPSRHVAELLSIIASQASSHENRRLANITSAVAQNAFIDVLLNINSYHANGKTSVSLEMRNALERIAQLAPFLRTLSKDRVEREALDSLTDQTNTMISGLGKLQADHARRNRILEAKIEDSQRRISHISAALDAHYVAVESKLGSTYSFHLGIINGTAIVIGLIIIALTFLLSEFVFNSIRQPLTNLLKTVEAFSAGNFSYPVPHDDSHEFKLLSAALKDFRDSSLQRIQAEQALRESEERFRTLSGMSSDFFWEQNAGLEFEGFSGHRATHLLASKVLPVGIKAWDNPRNVGYEANWERLRQRMEAREAFRNFEFSLRMPDGSLLYLLVNGDPIMDSHGTFRGYRGTAKDISTQKATEAEILVLNQTLEQRVSERTRELREANEQLSQAMEHLVQSEKLASLGNLVAGVAHELNTPLGNALVATTSMRDHVGDLKTKIAGSQLRKSDLQHFLETFSQGCELVENNTHRAVNLISSFKQVAVDQTSAQRRSFDLHQTVQEVISTLGAILRKNRLEVSLDIPPDLILDSYPGPLDQVLTNIITNATIHAYAAGQNGSLLIQASRLGEEQVELLVADSGSGIPADRQGKVFDPFFTTRLGQGGSGLGLYIVYNIVTSLLGGSIQLISVPEAGTCFVIRLPLTAPLAEDTTGNVHYITAPGNRARPHQTSLTRLDDITLQATLD